jgi:TrmH family RNA methyltransferase
LIFIILKVVQATMGSIARVNVNYIDLCSHFEKTKLPLFQHFMEEILFINADYPRRNYYHGQ